jgi:hypothetical protein
MLWATCFCYLCNMFVFRTQHHTALPIDESATAHLRQVSGVLKHIRESEPTRQSQILPHHGFMHCTMKWNHLTRNNWRAPPRLALSFETYRRSLNLHLFTSQIILLLTCPRVLIQMPLHIPILILQRPAPNLKKPHCHPGPHLRQFYTLIPGLYKDVMPYLDTIFHVFKCDHPIADLLREFPWWEDVLEDLDDSLAEICGEALEDEVRVRFANGTTCGVGYIGTEDDIMKGEGCCRAVRNM